MINSDDYHEALQCPKCPDLYLESLWSLIAHVNCSHADTSDILTFSSLQKCKKVVSKSKVCVLRPAFKDDGTRNDYLNYGPDGCFIQDTNSKDLISTSLDTELNESFNPTAIPSTTSSMNPSTFISFNNVIDMISNSSRSTSIQRQSSSTPEDDKVISPTVIDDDTNINISSSNKKIRRNVSYTRSIKKQVCQMCGEIFDNRCLLTLHLMEHKKRTHPYQCTINGCYQCYDTKLKFKSHLTRVHRDLTTQQIDDILNQFKNTMRNVHNNDEKNTVENILVKKEIS